MPGLLRCGRQQLADVWSERGCPTGVERESFWVQARLSIQAPIQAIQLAISLGLPRQVCGACYTSRSHAACLLNMHTQQLLVGFLAPLAIVYIAERRFRANFLSSQAKKLS